MSKNAQASSSARRPVISDEERNELADRIAATLQNEDQIDESAGVEDGEQPDEQDVGSLEEIDEDEAEAISLDSDESSDEDEAPATPQSREELEPEDDEEEGTQEVPDEAKDLVMVYRLPKCLECDHLVAGAPKSFTKCHYLNGNDACPAQRIRIAEGLPIETAAQGLAEALTEQDLKRITKINKRLSHYDDVLVKRVKARAAEIMRERILEADSSIELETTSEEG